ncbi:tRNA glutamyl-Q(34) synthetase GluQRS [Nakamurella lactea]|uniref:tRNA glutamyl-Q(34) synthetase GluQRS n=1 Tax=Nakamurella lactea TaxID=459515 RepID=UPI0003FC8460|nr:tRNA glutamyl-Q(34) synthetase GluQRS [Nakamurella lactea]
MTTRPEQPTGSAPHSSSGAGRYAPSPSGDLHLGNLRTALLAWLFARAQGREFLVRIEDLDERTRPGAAQRQLDDLASLGLDWDAPPLRQSEHRDRYRAVVDGLADAERSYECYCSRKDILAAPTAPHAPPGAYPGTCRNLPRTERERRRNEIGRPPSIRLRSDTGSFTVTDGLHGAYTGAVDDFVLERFDGTPAYNLVSVVDDAFQGVGQVVRGDDLLPSTPRQAYLATVLGHPVPAYAHVPLVLNDRRERLAKRDGAVTLAELAGLGRSPADALSMLAHSVGLAEPGEPVSPALLLSRFDPARLPREPWVLPDEPWVRAGR